GSASASAVAARQESLMAEAAEAAPAADEEESGSEKRMPFLAHLDELRSCLRNSSIALFGGTIVAYPFRAYFFALLVRPLMRAWNETPALGRGELVMLSPHEGFMVLFKLALVVGVFLASPFVFREIWKFIAPGLYSRERKWGLGFVVASVVLFFGGAAFAYTYVLPASYKYFLGYSAESMGIIRDVFGKQEIWGYTI